MEIRGKRSAANGMLNSNLYFLYIYGNFRSFCLLTHLQVNIIRETGVLNKHRLRNCTVIGDKQFQKKERGHFEQRISSKKAV